MKEKIKIIIAEEKELNRKALISLLKENKNFTIINEASKGIDLLNKVKQSEQEIVLIDDKIADNSILETIRSICKICPKIKVLILGDSEDCEHIIELISHGANGYLSRSSSQDELYSAVKKIVSHGKYYDTKVSEIMMKGFIKSKPKGLTYNKLLLTDREISVIREICNGNTNKDISEKLYISKATVDYHKGNIYKKTNAKNMADLVIYAVKNGIINVSLAN
ncbi:MAG: LuxR C-terminal-related transcriptional regulator [Sphingobacteriaceae bacterium]